MPTLEIIKVQRPLDDPAAPWCIYANGHRRLQMHPADEIPDRVVKAMGADPKGYFQGVWHGDLGWAVGERVADQVW